MNGLVCRWIGVDRWVYGWVYVCMDRWVGGSMDGIGVWMD